MEEFEQRLVPLRGRWAHTGLWYMEEDSGTVHDGDDGDDYDNNRKMSSQHLLNAYYILTAY